MNPESFLLEQRRPKYEEVNFFLFEECNLHCKFCFQKNYLIRRPSMPLLDKKLQLMHEVISGSPKKLFEIQMMGGELFYDALDDIYFDKYFEIITTISNYAKSLGKVANWVITSNLVHTKRDRVVKLLEKIKENDIKIHLCSSFDFVSRFTTNEQLDTYYNSCKFYRDLGYLKTCSFLISKPNVEVLMGKRQEPVKSLETFNRLYKEGFHLSQEFYSPFSKNYKDYNLSEREFLDFMYFVLDNYPNIHGVHELESRPCGPFCQKLTFISSEHGIVKGNCMACSNAELSYLSTVPNVKGNEDLEQFFMKEKGCLKCNYFARCKMGCFVFFGFKDRLRLSKCLFNCMYKYIETGIKEYPEEVEFKEV